MIYKIKNHIVIDTVIYISLIFFFLFQIINFNYSAKNILVVISFLMVGAMSFFRIITIGKNVSLIRQYYIFVFVFFFFSALSQYCANSNIWAKRGLNISFNDDDYLFANFLIVLFSLTIEVSYYFFNKKIKTNNKSKFSNLHGFEKLTYHNLNIINIIAFVTLLLTNNIVSKNGLDLASGSLSIQLLNILKFIPVASFLISMIANKNVKKSLYSKISILFYFVMICVIYFPFSGTSSRFLLFGCYLCIGTLFFKRIKCKSLYFLMFVIGFLFVFSSFNYFKYNDDLSNFVLFSSSNLNAEDFDAYQVFLISISYTKSASYMYGSNFLSALLCFLPRSIFSFRNFPSGDIISGYFGMSFNNISCPLIAEFYLSFGMLGVLIGGIMIGLIFLFFDKKVDGSNYYFQGLFCILSGLEIYVLRGAFLPTWSYTFGLILSFSIIYLIYILTCRKQNHNSLTYKSIHNQKKTSSYLGII